MKPVRVSTDFGIVIRRVALGLHGVSTEQIIAVMESPPLDESDDLLSFGPHFGIEAADEFGRRLQALGLVFVEDYFVFEELVPPWCTPYAGLAG